MSVCVSVSAYLLFFYRLSLSESDRPTVCLCIYLSLHLCVYVCLPLPPLPSSQTVELIYPTDEFDLLTIAQLALSLSASVLVVGLLVWIFRADTAGKRRPGGGLPPAADWEVEELSQAQGKKKR